NTTGNGILSTIRSVTGNGVFSITNNIVNQPIQGTTAYGIRVDAGNGTEASGTTLCLIISGNTTTGGKNGSGSIQAPGIGLRQENASKISGVYPNQLANLAFVLSMNNVAKRNYDFSVNNNSGQLVYRTSIIHEGGSAARTIQRPATLSKGQYQLVLFCEGVNYKHSV